jgi:hypothetical protein
MFTEDESGKRIVKIAAVGGGLLLVVVVGAWLLLRRDLPTVRGLTVYEWLHKLRMAGARDRIEAYDAIKEMGPAALEYVRAEAAEERNIDHRTVLEDLIRDLERIQMMGPGWDRKADVKPDPPVKPGVR